MSQKTQHNNIILAVIVFAVVVIVVGIIGFLTLGNEDEEAIQGEVEVSEYRVSCKLPGRVVEIRVMEGDYVKVGDTLAIIEVPEAEAQKRMLEATGEASEAMREMTDAGTRKEQVQAAYQLLQQAKASSEIAQKTYTRMQNLYDEGVVSGQKRDESFAAYKASEAQVNGAQSQYEMAKNGAREQEKRIAAKNALAAKNAVDVVNSMLRETVQVAQVEGEVSEVYSKVGELVGMGSPIISISILDDLWGTFSIREDLLRDINIDSTFTAFVPAFNKEIQMKVYYMRDKGAYAAWKATKATGDYDRKTFEVRARPITKLGGLRPGMSLIVKE